MNSINFINILRAFAALLIVNSHSDKLFPTGLSSLGTGGSIGNAIFFFTSGYTLSIGIRKNSLSYFSWLQKRITRLYPSFLIFTMISSIALNTSYRWLDLLFFNGSWFLQAIVVYYIIFFHLIKYLDNYLWYLLVANYVGFVLYLSLTGDNNTWTIDMMDNPTKVHWVYYFLVMLMGAIVSKNDSIFKRSGPGFLREVNLTKVQLTFFVLLSIAIFYTPKLLFAKKVASGLVQFVYPFFLMLATYMLYLASVRFATTLRRDPPSIAARSIVFISYLTLDIYIVHFSIVHAIRDSGIMFPLNYILSVLLIVTCAYILNKLSDKAFSLFSRLNKKIV